MDKPAGVEMPEDDLIKRMFQKNSDGAGFALQGWFKTKGADGTERKKFDVVFSKGYMKVEDLLEALGNKEKLKNLRVIIHCRIKTHGEADKYTTHPFILSTCYGELRKLEGRGQPVLFHNGVFTGLGGVINKDASDTQDFTAGIASKLLKDGAHISKISKKIAENAAGSCRVLILYPDPKHPDFRLGSWDEGTITDGCQGCLFSNSGFKKSYSSGYGTNYYGFWDDDDEWDKRYAAKKLPTIEAPWKGVPTHIDEYGCNDGEYAHPGNVDNHWIKLHTKERLEVIKRQASSIEDGTSLGDGSDLYYFCNNPNPWIIDEDALMMYDPEGYEMFEQYLDDLELMLQEEEERKFEENVKYFDNFADLDEFIESGRPFGEFGVTVDGKDFYTDMCELAAYTFEGLKLVFKSGEVGHVKAALEKHGYNDYSGYWSERQQKERAEKEKHGDKPESTGKTLHKVKSEGTVHRQDGRQLLLIPHNVSSDSEIRETIR